MRFGDELAGYILCDSSVSFFSQTLQVSENPPRAVVTLDLTYNFTPFQAVLFESGTQLSPIYQIARLLYLKIWLRPHQSIGAFSELLL